MKMQTLHFVMTSLRSVHIIKIPKEGTIDLVTKVTTLYDDEGNPINYLLINADKTETTIAYNKIQEFEEFFELVGDYAKSRICPS